MFRCCHKPTATVPVAAHDAAAFDIFISLRFSEARNAGKALQRALEARGLKVFLCEVPPGSNIAKVVIRALHGCRMAVILGTRTYGKETDSSFSTFDELQYIVDRRKPFFLVKMCDDFEEPEAQFHLRSNVAYFAWTPKNEDTNISVPPPLVDDIVGKLKEQTPNTLTNASGQQLAATTSFDSPLSVSEPPFSPGREDAKMFAMEVGHEPLTVKRGCNWKRALRTALAVAIVVGVAVAVPITVLSGGSGNGPDGPGGGPDGPEGGPGGNMSNASLPTTTSLPTTINGTTKATLAAAGTGTFGQLGPTADKWLGGVLASNGLIYAAPWYSPSVLIINPSTNTVDTTTISGLGTDPAKWAGGVMAHNGLVYMFPSNRQSMLIIDPDTNAVDITSIHSLGSTSNKWYSGVVASNQLIFGIPLYATYVLIIDPKTSTADITTMAGLSSGTHKWYGGVQADNDLIYCIPVKASSVLIINPGSLTMDLTTISDLSSTGSKWYGGVLAENGFIYTIPAYSATILVIDPATNATNELVVAPAPGSLKWNGGVLAPNGNIIGIPHDSQSVLVLDPTTNTTDTTTISNLHGSAKWLDGVLAPNGLIYGIPHDAESVLVIDPGC
ncbi:hypothetical protein PTSG_02868 [Salpingoeca rosetta]|uniref:TIR domain-containing protein n=1 Tax=Salpingoeca rosetta (strain ATCC 50818 / BSB-021) TaxID=946362 RepID=F2U3K2_SALR5|nr:uncharacterized protein PTSG_02868 [Salpingoeca rosetta]EGD82196.1 hypothetical protein PTSG_02868 [Salpingoeca rosetta]|eukprot:XP_004996379.1 hypothetical protein PTSG_02868 [Salpingoeca rosetta]